MSNKQKTAVDILFEQLNAECMRSFDSNMYRYFLSKIEQAKAMEKEQIINAFDTAYSFNHNVSDPSAQEYYNKFYEH